MTDAQVTDFRAEQRPEGSLDRWLRETETNAGRPAAPHPLDSLASKKLHGRLFEWYEQEREKQAANRYQQAIDQDFYDNLQWSDEDVQELAERGQAALTFNETAPTIDWIIGTEKRTRIDFKVLPRAEDDVKPAESKTKVMKYLSDVNRSGFARSLAFADSVKVGIGWLEAGVRDDGSEEMVFDRYESWRNMLWDSSCTERDLSDARYVFRWRWTDLDVAIAMFPEREAQLRSAAVAANLWGTEEDEDFWYLGQHYQVRDRAGEVVGRRSYVNDVAHVNNRRARVKLIECWYRIPETVKVIGSGFMKGRAIDQLTPYERQLAETYVNNGVSSLYDAVRMRVRCAMLTERDLLQEMPSPYRHDRFPFTPIWCYRRGRDGMPYGPTRRFRDVQEDLNKRASKALFILSTNQVVADSDALDGTDMDWDDLRAEAARPDAVIIKKRGSTLDIRRDVQLAEEHLMLMDRDARLIRNSAGVTDDNLGRRTNAISGEAIKARQLQGSVVTAEIFDNLRFSTQIHGEKMLSLAEQWMGEPQVIRLLGAKNAIDWLRINEPQVDASGQRTYKNDITARQADFVVDEQDFHQSTRQAMFETMSELVGRVAQIDPQAGLRILAMSLEFSDIPNKEEFARDIRRVIGMDDPDKDPAEMSDDERAAWQKKQLEKKQAEDIQREAGRLQMEEQAAKVEKLVAEAERTRAQAEEAVARATAIQNDSQNAVKELTVLVQQLLTAVQSKESTNGGGNGKT